MRIMAISGKIGSALFFGLMAILLMMGSAQAQVTVYLEDDLKVTFSSGSFDNRNFNGDIQDVAIFIDDHRVLTADEVEVDTSGEPGTVDHVIKLLRMKNVFFDDMPLSIKEILIQDMASNVFLDVSDKPSYLNSISDKSNFTLTGLAYSANGVSMTLDRFASLPFTFGVLANGAPFIAKLGTEVENMIITPLQNRDAFAQFISATGEPDLTLNMTQTQVNEVKNGIVSSDMALKITMNGIGNLDAQLGVQMSLDSYNKLFMSDTYNVRPDDIEDVALDDMVINFDDHGAVNAALQMSAIKQNVDYAVARDNIIMMMKSALGSFLPNSVKDLFPPLERFIKDSGQLRLSALPARPFLFANATQYIFSPEAAIKDLNLKLTHAPASEDSNAVTVQKTNAGVR